jgi:hypothetical protein
VAEIGNPVLLAPGSLVNKVDPLRKGSLGESGVLLDMTLAENVNLDDVRVASLREGRTSLIAGVPHSFWVNPLDDTEAYYVENRALMRLNLDDTATPVTMLVAGALPEDPPVEVVVTLANNNPLIFEPVNDDVVITNGSDIGWLKAGVYTPFAPTLGQFEAVMPAGQFLAFFNGVLYVAAGQVIYASKPYNVEVCDERFNAIPLASAVRMLASVGDGLWISTCTEVVFLAGGGTEEFVYSAKANTPALYGAFTTDYATPGDVNSKIVVWVSEDGLHEGRSGGAFVKKTSDDLAFPKATSGKVFKKVVNGIEQWIAVIHNPLAGEVYTPKAVTVDSSAA